MPFNGFGAVWHGSLPDMPASAIASGCIDFILSPEDIAQKIREIAFK
jgi:chemotaxis response regulator CheB